MRNSLGLLIVLLAVTQLVVVWAFALPRLMGTAGTAVVASESILETPAPDEGPLACEEPATRNGTALNLDSLHRPW